MADVREFETGATRNVDTGKLDYEAFFAPTVLERFAQYMHKHRLQSDGKLRDGDNWQKGIPMVQYMKSLVRHVFDLWATHRGLTRTDEHGNVYTQEELCCAVMFNVMGYLFEMLREKPTIKPDEN